jgi:topoisomerase-4 subunit A
MTPDQQEFDLNGNGAPPAGTPEGGEETARGWALGDRVEGPLKRLIDDNFLQYASYVIRDRAIPDLDDGLKPVQRRILYSLHENDDGKFIKVANIAGYCMQYHPHGNVSIEDALVSLANRQFLIEGQGNFGNLYTGDPAAASRYIECRLTDLARGELFDDAITRFVPSYDGRRKEPVALPAKLPLLLMLGAEGIAVGLSTRILPHNFGELLKAQIDILKGKKHIELLPDFPQGGLMDPGEYAAGNGRIKVRAVVEIGKGGNTLVIRELPFATTTDGLIGSIEDAARKKKIKIRSIDDFTAEQVEIQVHLAPGEDPEKALKALYAFTQCEMSVSARAIVIHENRPREMDVVTILRHNTRRLVEIIKEQLELQRERLLEDLHFKTLAQLFVEHRIYKRIEDCESYRAVQEAVLNGMNAFREHLRRDVTLDDVEKLLAIPIKRISLFDIHKNRKEIGDIVAQLGEVESRLSDLTATSIQYLKELLSRHAKAFPRRTRVAAFEQVERRALAAEEYRVRWDRDRGYVGYESEGDEVFACSSYDRILLAWRDGAFKVIPPPDKLFVDTHLLAVAPYDRDREYLAVYTLDGVSYMKRFTFGGAIMNRDYEYAPPGAQVLLLADNQPSELFVRYKPAKNQRIHRQVFDPGTVPVRGVKARGNQITVKKIAAIDTQKPRTWDRGQSGPRGVALDF